MIEVRPSKIAAIRDTAARVHAPRPSARDSVIPWYSSGMTAKRKVSVSLDEDLVAELEAADEALSGQVNEAIRAEPGGAGGQDSNWDEV